MATTPSETPLKRRRLGRMLLGLFAAFAGLIILVLAFLPYLVSLESIKGELVSQVEAALHRQVDIGAVRLQILTGLGASLEDLHIDNPPGWPQQRFLKIGTLALKVAFLPLLQGKIEVTKMTVHDGDILIERDASGHLNVADLAEINPGVAPRPARPAPQASPAEAPPPAVSSLASLLVSDVALDSITITFVDRMVASGQVVTTTVSDIRGHLRDLSLKTPIPFDMAATVLTDGNRNIRFRGTVGPLPEDLEIAGAPLDAHLQAADLLLAPLTPYLSQRFPLSRGRLGADVKVRGSLGGDLRINGALSLADAAIRDPKGGQAETAFPKLTSSQDLTLDLPRASINLLEARLNLLSLQATLTGAVSKFRTTPQFDLQLSTNAFAPGEVLTQVPLLASAVPAPVDLHGSVQLQATLTGTPGKLRSEAQLDVSHLSLKSGSLKGGTLDGGGILVETDTAHVTLTTQLEDLHSPHVRMDLRAQRLVFDQPEAKAPVPAQPPPSGPTNKAPATKTTLPPVTLNGTIKVAEGHYKHLRFQQLTADVALVQGLLKSKHQAKLYGGTYQGMMQINLTQAEPAYSLDANVAGLHLGEAAAALTPAKNFFEGALTAQIKLAGQGLTWAAIGHTLSGDGNIKITGARFTPPDATPELSREVTIISPLGKMTTHINLKRHAFNAVEAIFRIGQGKIYSNHIQLSGNDIQILAKGYLGLDQSLDYSGNLVLSGKRASERTILSTFLRDIHGRIILPFMVKGTVRDPKIVVDAKDVLARARGTLSGKMGKETEGTP
jgi:uncharacterized protein involved in outer membrane biogenesis